MLNHFSLLLSFICSTSLVLSLYVLFLIIHQAYLMVNGQTWHEYGKRIQIYNNHKNVHATLETVLGKRWYLILFSPLIASPPLGDGMAFDMGMTETGEAHRPGLKRT